MITTLFVFYSFKIVHIDLSLWQFQQQYDSAVPQHPGQDVEVEQFLIWNCLILYTGVLPKHADKNRYSMSM